MPNPVKQSDYPYKFNTTELPFMSTWNESFSEVLNTNTSEAGTDIDTVVRKGKLKVIAGCGCLSSMRTTLEGFYAMDSFTLHRYDYVTGAYKEHNVRMKNYSAERMYKSESVENTVGLWKVSFDLEEF